MVCLEKEDIEELIKAIKKRKFSKERYCDKETFEMEKERDLNFCGKALQMVIEDFAVYYDSWW